MTRTEGTPHMPPIPIPTAARPRWSAGLAALTIALLLAAGLAAVPASASDTEQNSPAPPATAVCTGVADVWHVDGPQGTEVQDKEGITYPTTSNGTAQPPRNFAWRLTTTCEFTAADGNIVDTGDLDVSGWANGWCGSSRAEPPKGMDDDSTKTLSNGVEIENNRGTFTQTNRNWVVHVWDIRWENIGRSLALDLRHDAGSNEEPDGAPGAAEADLIGGEEDCATNFGATTFDTIIAVEFLPGTDDAGDLIDQEPPKEDERESDGCRLQGGDRIVDSTTAGVRTSVYVHQPDTGEVWLCGRVDDGSGEGYGGRLELTPTEADPQLEGVPGVPEVDGQSLACTDAADNDAPGPRPLAHGGIGTADYLFDIYVAEDGSEAWVCVQVDSQDTRVIVPLGDDGGPGVSFGSVATWYPDEGTPSL